MCELCAGFQLPATRSGQKWSTDVGQPILSSYSARIIARVRKCAVRLIRFVLKRFLSIPNRMLPCGLWFTQVIGAEQILATPPMRVHQLDQHIGVRILRGTKSVSKQFYAQRRRFLNT